jgi:hypothetical protein
VRYFAGGERIGEFGVEEYVILQRVREFQQVFYNRIPEYPPPRLRPRDDQPAGTVLGKP